MLIDDLAGFARMNVSIISLESSEVGVSWYGHCWLFPIAAGNCSCSLQWEDSASWGCSSLVFEVGRRGRWLTAMDGAPLQQSTVPFVADQVCRMSLNFSLITGS